MIRDFKMTNQVTDHGMLGATKEGIREELKKCLYAGKVPEAYKDVVFEIKVEEACRSFSFKVCVLFSC